MSSEDLEARLPKKRSTTNHKQSTQIPKSERPYHSPVGTSQAHTYVARHSCSNSTAVGRRHFQKEARPAHDMKIFCERVRDGHTT